METGTSAPAQRDLVNLLQVEVDLNDGGRLRIGGREVPYTSPGLAITVPLDDAPQLTIPTLALGGLVSGMAQVTYEVTYLDQLSPNESHRAQGGSVPDALRALADLIEADRVGE